MRREQMSSALRVMTITGTLCAGLMFHHFAFAQKPPFDFNTSKVGNGFGDDTSSESSTPPTGADGVSFMPVPLDTTVNCNSVILKGTRRYQGTAFVLPRVVIAMNKQKETQFEIIQLEADQYLVRFAVYFPRTDDELSLHMRGQNVRLQGCDFGAVIANLNRNVKDENAQVKTLSRIPISGVAVRVDGVKGAYTLGAVEGSILHYQGLDHVVEFPMTRKQLDATLARIEGNIGLGIHIAIKFNARSGDGALYVNANLNELATGLEASLRGKKMIAAGQLATMIENNISKMNLDVESESSNSRVFQVASEQIMEMIVDSLSGRNKDDWGSWGSSKRDGSWNNGNWDTGRNSPFTLGISNGNGDPLNPGGPGTDPDWGNTIGGDAMVNVELMLKLLRTKKNFKVSYTNMGPSAQQVYSTSVLFRGEIADPDIRILNVSGGIENARIIPNRLLKGKQLTFAVAGRIPEKIEYIGEKRYLSAKQVGEMQLAKTFPMLRNQRAVLRDRPSYLGPIGALRAKGWFSSDYYTWSVVEAKTKTKRGKMVEVALESDVVGKLPLQVRFSKVGLRKFTLAQLLTENAYWKGEWDEMGGKIIFTPKQNLGQMQIINMEEDQMIQIKRQIFIQERRSGRDSKLMASTQTKPEIMEVPTFRATYQLQLSHDAQEGDVVATITPEGSSNPAAPVIIPAPMTQP